MNKAIGKFKSDKEYKTIAINILVFLVLSFFLFLLIPHHLSVKRFEQYFGKDNLFVKYTNIKDYNKMSHNTGRVLEGVKTGHAYIVCYGKDAQKVFENTFSDCKQYEITQAALAKNIESFGVPVGDFYVYMFVFKNGSEAKEFYDYYCGSIKAKAIEQGKEKGYSYTVCYKNDRMGCYLENNTVLLLNGYGGRRFFDILCKKWGIKSPYDPSLDKRAGSK